MRDWAAFFNKIKWQLISFKFLSFWVCISLLVFAWVGLVEVFNGTISVARNLFEEGYITSDHVTKIITHSQSVLFDSALGHILVFFVAILGSIIAIKGVSYWTNSQQTKEVIKNVSKKTAEDLKQYLPHRGE